MSKILLNHTYRCVALTVLPSAQHGNIDGESDSDDPVGDIIRFMCSDVDSVSTQRLLNRLSRTIIKEGIYTQTAGAGVGVGVNGERGRRSGYGLFGNGGLIPTNSKLYAHGTSTNNVPDIKQVRDYIEVKLKIDQVEESHDESEKMETGHFRFHLPPMIPPQILVLVRTTTPNRILLMFHGNQKFLSVLTRHIKSNFNCTTMDVRFTNSLLRQTLEWAAMNDTLESIGTMELWFGKLNTKRGKLGSIIIRVNESDLLKLRTLIKQHLREHTHDTETTLQTILYEYLTSRTSIQFDALPLVKLRCELFTISVDGKVRFTSSMSHLGHTAKLSKKDDRLSIWWVIRKLLQ